jgi:hypothetical protein
MAHVKLGGNQMVLQRATLARFGLELLPRTLALEHDNSESFFEVLAIATGSVAIPPTSDKTRMLEKRIARKTFRILACDRHTIDSKYLGGCFK